MRRFKDVNEAIQTLATWGGWVGTPAIEYGGDVVDGTTRMEAWRQLGFLQPYPRRLASTRAECVRLLVLAGEAPRAERMIGGKLDDAAIARATYQLTTKQVAPIVDRKLRCAPGLRATVYSAREHLTLVCRLYYAALEDGRETVELNELGNILSTAPQTVTRKGYAT